MKKINFVVMGLVFTALIGLVAGQTAEGNKKVIILYKDKVKEDDIKQLHGLGASIKYTYTIMPGVAASMNEHAIEALKKNKNIEAIYEDAEVHALLDDSIPQIGADIVHGIGGDGTGVTVCVVDTGVDDDHPAISTLVAEIDYVNDDNDATDDAGHGTHVAGIVASTNSVFTGTAPGVSLKAAKVLDSSGSGYTSDVIAGINWCVSEGVDIITMSLGGASYRAACDFDATAIASNNAVNAGVVVLAASGNNGFNNKISSPACGSKVIAVGAVDKSDVIAYYSNEGSQLDVVAPGSSITSTYLNGAYAIMSGTSMATPHAAGVAALILQANPDLSPAEVREVMRSTAKDLGAAGFDTTYGYGRIDAYAAYMAVAGVNQPPVANAGPDQTITLSEGSTLATVLLDGSASYDPDGSIELYEWTCNGEIVNYTAITTTELAAGNHTCTLTVTDDEEATDSDEVNIYITPYVNLPPVANAGGDQTVIDMDSSGSETVTLDGSASYDLNGYIAGYEWTIDGTPVSTEVSFPADLEVGTHLVTLTVTDDEGATASDTVSITVNQQTVQEFTLSATAYRTGANSMVDLVWSGAVSDYVDIYGNAGLEATTLITTTVNDGSYTYNVGKKISGTYTYKVCDQDTEVCSNEATVTFS